MAGDCRKCDNTGSVTCPTCKGERRLECRKCQGTRYLGIKRRPCPRCEGDGYLRCKRCDDLGEISCNQCDRWILRHPAGKMIMETRQQREEEEKPEEKSNNHDLVERKKKSDEAWAKWEAERKAAPGPAIVPEETFYRPTTLDSSGPSFPGCLVTFYILALLGAGIASAWCR